MKKWLAVLAIITCVFTLTACGSSSSKIDGAPMDAATESSWVQSAEQLVAQMQQIAGTQQEAQYTSDAVMGPAFTSFDSAIEEIGTINGYMDEYAVYSDDDEISISVGVDGSDHDADVVIIVDETDTGYETQSITTNVRYSFGELMEQAALNTVLGMGTTFVILIMLCLIISCFQFIPKIKQIFAKKPAAPAPEVKAAVPAPAPAEEEEYTDDNELVAVIAAAIAASEGRETTDGFFVRSIRKSRKKF